jgi:hypothetical protein
MNIQIGSKVHPVYYGVLRAHSWKVGVMWRGVKLTTPPSNTTVKKKSKYTSTPSTTFTV